MAKITGLDGMPMEAEENQYRITLTLGLSTGKLSIDGDLQNLDRAINTLEQALRWMNARYNAFQQIKLVEELQRDQQLMEMTRQ